MTRQFAIKLFALAALAIAAATSAVAHHAFVVEYDLDERIELTGAITRARFIYPHSWLYIEVVSDEGYAEEWSIEGATPATLMRRGWDSDSLTAGTVIQAKGYQAKDNSRRVAGWEIRLPGGEVLFMASAGISHLEK